MLPFVEVDVVLEVTATITVSLAALIAWLKSL